MNTRRILALILSITLALACNLPLSSPASPAPNPPGSVPTDTLAPGQPTETPASGSPVSPAATPTSPQITPISTVVNCRSGPDTSYSVTDTINLGQVATIAGKNSDGTWWYVQDPNNPAIYCWVSASVVTASGNLAGVGIVAAPPTSSAPTSPASPIVTNVTVGVNVTFNMCGGPNVADFSGSITASGPTKVTFRWEITGDKTNTTPEQTLTFKGAGTKNAPSPGAYTADCGHYKITLHVLSPNDTSASKSFKIGP